MMKDKNVAAILALFLGGMGVHKFYLGRLGAGFLYLLFSWTFIPAMLGLIDFFILALMDSDEFHRRYNGSHMLSPVVVNMLPPPPQYPGYGSYYPQYPGQASPPPGGGHHGYGHPAGYPSQPTSHGGGLSPDDLAQKLEKLNELRISGLLTEDEFQAQKAKILSQV